MFNSEPKKLTDLSQVFLEPTNATHRQYEALRAFFVDGLPGVEVARRFGYTPGSFRVLVHQFRQSPRRDFFLTPAKGPHSAPKSDPLRDRIIALRKQNLSIYDISCNLAHQGHPLSPVTVPPARVDRPGPREAIPPVPWARSTIPGPEATQGVRPVLPELSTGASTRPLRRGTCTMGRSFDRELYGRT